jgi:uncharacterized membrane protein
VSDYERIGDEQLRNDAKVRAFVIRIVRFVVRLLRVVEVLTLGELFRRVLILVLILELFTRAYLLRYRSLGGGSLR